MANKKKQKMPVETDSTYFLKIVMFLILGSLWLRIESFPDWSLPVPLGLVIGLVYASHDHFRVDRKIEFAILLVATFVAFWLPIGINVQL